MSTIANAISAYSNAAGSTLDSGESSGSSMSSVAPVPGTDFASVLKDAAKVSIGALKESETMSAAAIAGKADIRDVVAAVNNAQATLETVVNVRDKMVSAYNEIMRMSI